MLQTLALAAALSLAPAQNGPLTLANERVTLGGILGPRRPTTEYLPGDVVYLALDVENLQMAADGTVNYSIALEVTDPTGKSVYSAKPGSGTKVMLPLGGKKLPASGFFYIQTDQKPGVLTCTVTVQDISAKAVKSIATKITVVPLRFGIVALTAFFDPGKQVAAPLQTFEGQNLWLLFGLVGFGRDAKTKQPDVNVELRVYEDGKAVNQVPMVIKLDKVVGPNDSLIDFDTQPLPLNRPGTFMVELKAECKVTGKTDKIRFPVTVAPLQR